MQLETISC